jgi:hypothetical protein
MSVIAVLAVLLPSEKPLPSQLGNIAYLLAEIMVTIVRALVALITGVS